MEVITIRKVFSYISHKLVTLRSIKIGTYAMTVMLRRLTLARVI
jgi:hypothetical protein